MNAQSPLEALFFAALEMRSHEERAAYLDKASAGDADLRKRVEKMLAAQALANSFLEEPAGSPVLAIVEAPIAEGPGTVIGPYKLMEQIGEGGMGLVFVAEQQQPVRRKVALKVIKPGMDTRQVVARFEAEKQALALMDHPNIAKVLDGGETGSRRPYFVMELVKGVPITEYCDQKQVSIRERLELFGHVCHAVQHAHQKGIIHRDLKPSNVLVASHDGLPVVKIIDFGVAKAIGQQLSERTVYTQFAQLIGTPLYMSPEQAGESALDVDTRSDIYSLGVLLYELLTGTTPFEKERLKETDLDEVRRIIREEEPPKPSARMSTLGQAATTLSTQRKSDPKRLSQLFRGELDWIVMKCLEKDRDRRYETANGLAMDLQRYLTDEPVLACPPSAWYRFRKWVRRNKGKVTAAAAMLALVLAGTAASTWQAVRATRAEKRSSVAQEQTRQALDTLIDEVVLTMFTKQSELGEQEHAFLRKVLGFYETFTDPDADSAEARFVRAKGHARVAKVRGFLGQHGEAVAGYRRCEALMEQLAAEFPEAAIYRRKLALTEGIIGIELVRLGNQADAETAFLRGIALFSQLTAEFPQDLEYRQELATMYNDFGAFRELQQRFAEAEENLRHSLDLKEKLVADAGDEPRYRFELSWCRANLGSVLRKLRKYEESEKLFRQALRVQEEHISKGPATAKDRQWLANSYSGLGVLLVELKRPEEAETALRQTLEVRRKLAEDFPSMLEYRRYLADATGNLALFLLRQGKAGTAVELYRQTLELRQAVVKQAGPVPEYRRALASSHQDLAEVLNQVQRPKEAETAGLAALEIRQKLADEEPRNSDYQNGLASALTSLAILHNQRGEFKPAAAYLEKARTHLQATLDKPPKDQGSRKSYRDYLAALAECQIGFADHAKVATTVAEIVRVGHDPVSDTYPLGCLVARCIPLANKDASLPEAKRKELAQSYTQQALALLRQAVSLGFKDVALMKKDTDVDALRSNEEFRKLLAELEAASGKR